MLLTYIIFGPRGFAPPANIAKTSFNTVIVEFCPFCSIAKRDLLSNGSILMSNFSPLPCLHTL